MSQLAMDQITITDVTDGEKGVSVKIVTPFYTLGTAAPDKPTSNPPKSIWTTTEPEYIKGKNLYTTQRTVLEDSTFSYSDVSLDSSYRASEQAITTADTAAQAATSAQTTADQAIFSTLPSLADPTKANNWLCAIFPAADGSSVQVLPSYSLIAPLAASYTEYHTDGTGEIFTKSVDYSYGLIRTLVSFNSDTTWTFTYSHDDGSRIYVDGINVFERAQYTQNDPVTISFTKGNHIVDVMYSNGIGGAGIWAFSVALSSIATTMYAPAGASALATALDKAQAAAKTAQTTADGKNKIFPANSEPVHEGLVPGDLWFQLNSSKQVKGIQMWNGSAFVDYVLMANEIIAAKTITGDKLDVRSVAAAIITSGLFQTASSGARVKIDSSGITGYNSTGATTFKIDAATGDVSMIGKFYSGDPSVSRVIIDDDYNKISNPGDVDVDGYVAFESHLSDESPIIGGMHSTLRGTQAKVSGAILTSGIADSSKPAGANIQLNSYEDGNASEASLMATMHKMDAYHNIAVVDVNSDKNGQVALIRADGKDKGKYASVESRVDSDGNAYVAIVTNNIVQVDPVTEDTVEIYSSKHELTSQKRCVFNWENDWTGVSNSGPGYLEGTYNFTMSHGWYLVEAYIRTNGAGKEYHLDMIAKRKSGTVMDSWAMNLPMPSTGMGNMVCSQMVYVNDISVDLAAQLYTRDYGSRPELFSGNDAKLSLFYPKRPLSRYFRIFAM